MTNKLFIGLVSCLMGAVSHAASWVEVVRIPAGTLSIDTSSLETFRGITKVWEKMVFTSDTMDQRQVKYRMVLRLVKFNCNSKETSIAYMGFYDTNANIVRTETPKVNISEQLLHPDGDQGIWTLVAPDTSEDVAMNAVCKRVQSDVSQRAEWIEIVNGGKLIVSINPASVQISGGITKVWTKTVMTHVQIVDGILKYDNTRQFVAYDCSAKTSNILSTFIYRGDNVITTSTKETGWTPVLPGTTNEGVMDAVCQRLKE
jgi:hypothetical protein